MGRKFLAVSFGGVALCSLAHCVGSAPALVADIPVDEAGTGEETGAGTEASTLDTGGEPDVSLDGGGDASPGAKQAFVTAGAFRGDMSIAGGGAATSGVAGADKRCMEAAASKFPGRTFRALVARVGENAFTHIGAGPWYLGASPVGDVQTLMGSGDPKTPLNVTETGVTLGTDATAWTGTTSDGDADIDYCAGWTDATDSVSGIAGTVGGTGGFWRVAGPAVCSVSRHLYCFEQ